MVVLHPCPYTQSLSAVVLHQIYGVIVAQDSHLSAAMEIWGVAPGTRMPPLLPGSMLAHCSANTSGRGLQQPNHDTSQHCLTHTTTRVINGSTVCERACMANSTVQSCLQLCLCSGRFTLRPHKQSNMLLCRTVSIEAMFCQHCAMGRLLIMCSHITSEREPLMQ